MFSSFTRLAGRDLKGLHATHTRREGVKKSICCCHASQPCSRCFFIRCYLLRQKATFHRTVWSGCLWTHQAILPVSLLCPDLGFSKPFVQNVICSEHYMLGILCDDIRTVIFWGAVRDLDPGPLTHLLATLIFLCKIVRMSGYKALDGIETALLKVFNNLF